MSLSPAAHTWPCSVPTGMTLRARRYTAMKTSNIPRGIALEQGGFVLTAVALLATARHRSRHAIRTASHERFGSAGVSLHVGSARSARRINSAPRVCGRERKSIARLAVGSTIDRPPPTVGIGDDDEGEAEFEVRFITNEDREYHAGLWLAFAGEEERKYLEDTILAFRSNKVFVGKTRVCVGAFIGNRCEGIACVEIASDLADLTNFFMQGRVQRCLAIATRPRGKTMAGSVLVSAVMQLAKDRGYRPDFDPIKDLNGGRYWILSRAV